MRASDSDRALVCPASLVLPKRAERSDKANRAADWGTLVHAWKETGDDGSSPTLRKKLLLSSIDREELWPTIGGKGGRHEVTFSINLETLQLRIWSPEGSAFGRDHWKRRHPANKYLTGTIDYLSRRNKGQRLLPWVDDLKTGTWPVSAKYSKQLKSYALVPWILGNCETDVLASITQWPKYKLSGKPKRNFHVLTSADLVKHLHKIRWAVNNTSLVYPTKSGCMFCPCKPDCVDYQESEF